MDTLLSLGITYAEKSSQRNQDCQCQCDCLPDCRDCGDCQDCLGPDQCSDCDFDCNDCDCEEA